VEVFGGNVQQCIGRFTAMLAVCSQNFSKPPGPSVYIVGDGLESGLSDHDRVAKMSELESLAVAADVGRGIQRDARMQEDREEFLPTRWSLLSRLKDWDDQESWRQFFDTYWKLIYTTALKAGLTHTNSNIAETIISIAKHGGIQTARAADPSKRGL
jgi:aspartate oxidase